MKVTCPILLSLIFFGILGAQTAAGAGGVIHLPSERHLDYHLLWPSLNRVPIQS